MKKYNHKKRKTIKRCVTLIEMMIVMFLIALITGVVAYNYRGTLESGKAFKTQASIEKLQTILGITLAEEPHADMSGNNWQKYVESSALVHDPKALLKDGWGESYRVEVDPDTNVIMVTSKKYDDYRAKHGDSLFRK